MSDVTEFALPARISARLPLVAARRASKHGLVVTCICLIASWIHRTHQRGALARLDDRMLKDVGITRNEAEHECAKPFWR